MTQPKDQVTTEHYKGYTNDQCEFFPCHKGIDVATYNCLFCYCPLVFLECPGDYVVFTDARGIVRKDCSTCTLPHNGYHKSWNFIQHWLNAPKPWKGE